MQQPLLKSLPVATTSLQEAWGPKNEYAIVTNMTQPYAYDVTPAGSSGACVGYQQPSPQGFPHHVPKIEIDASPVNLSMDV